jgi:hypothetical protein
VRYGGVYLGIKQGSYGGFLLPLYQSGTEATFCHYARKVWRQHFAIIPERYGDVYINIIRVTNEGLFFGIITVRYGVFVANK